MGRDGLQLLYEVFKEALKDRRRVGYGAAHLFAVDGIRRWISANFGRSPLFDCLESASFCQNVSAGLVPVGRRLAG